MEFEKGVRCGCECLSQKLLKRFLNSVNYLNIFPIWNSILANVCTKLFYYGRINQSFDGTCRYPGTMCVHVWELLKPN